MNEYLKAYRARLERNDAYFRKMAEEFQAKGFTVEMATDRLLSSITIRTPEKHVYFGFNEVPYRFTLSVGWKPNSTNGSGKTIASEHGTECTWTVDFIISQMYPSYKGQFKDENH